MDSNLKFRSENIRFRLKELTNLTLAGHLTKDNLSQMKWYANF